VTTTLPARSEVDRRFTWDRESVFPDEAGWDQAVDTILARPPDLAEFSGHPRYPPDAGRLVRRKRERISWSGVISTARCLSVGWDW
jgi:hypothetical protein